MDAKDKLMKLLETQKKAIEAQKAESERIVKEREQKAKDETGGSSPSLTQPPNR
jgi:hypothetical protein